MKKSFFSDSDRSTLRKVALEEIEGLADQIETVCDDIEAGGDVRENLVIVKRAFHTIGGSAGLAGFGEISALGIEGERLMESAERWDGEKAGSSMKRIRKLADGIRELVKRAGDG